MISSSHHGLVPPGACNSGPENTRTNPCKTERLRRPKFKQMTIAQVCTASVHLSTQGDAVFEIAPPTCTAASIQVDFSPSRETSEVRTLLIIPLAFFAMLPYLSFSYSGRDWAST